MESDHGNIYLEQGHKSQIYEQSGHDFLDQTTTNWILKWLYDMERISENGAILQEKLNLEIPNWI